MKKILKILNSLLFVFFICFMVYMLISSYDTMKTTHLLLVICIFPLIMVPFILDKIKIYHMDEVLIFAYYIFLLLSLVFGSILGCYRSIWWFDLLSHFTSGFLTSVLAYVILDKNNLVNKKNKWFSFMFIIIFSIAIAGIWEFFEFTLDLIIGGDTQHSLDTGVNDTMEDMLIATLASIISGFYYLFYIKKK